jgi:hypothetical protein
MVAERLRSATGNLGIFYQILGIAFWENFGDYPFDKPK